MDSLFAFSLELSFDDPASTVDHYTFYLSGWERSIRHEHDSETGEEWIDTSQFYTPYSVRIYDPIIEYTGDPMRFNHYDLSQGSGQYFHFSDKQINGEKHGR